MDTNLGAAAAQPAAQRAGVHSAGSARMIPVGGGKGGVGKTFLVVNLAASLARMGYRVIAVDGDLEGANLHTCIGVREPRASLADFVAQREEEDLGIVFPECSVQVGDRLRVVLQDFVQVLPIVPSPCHDPGPCNRASTPRRVRCLAPAIPCLLHRGGSRGRLLLDR